MEKLTKGQEVKWSGVDDWFIELPDIQMGRSGDKGATDACLLKGGRTGCLIAAPRSELVAVPDPTRCPDCDHPMHDGRVCGHDFGYNPTRTTSQFCGCCKMPKVDPPTKTPGQAFVEKVQKDFCTLSGSPNALFGGMLTMSIQTTFDAATAELQAQLKRALDTNAALQKGNDRLKEQRNEARQIVKEIQEFVAAYVNHY